MPRALHTTPKLLLLLAVALTGCTQTPAPVGAPPSAAAATADSTVLTLRPADGHGEGAPEFSNPLPAKADFFPLGMWHATVDNSFDLERDQMIGINTYVELTPASDIGLIQDAGMFALTSSASAKANGFVLPDEVDMWGRAGDARWTGNSPGEGTICDPPSAGCGFSILRETTKLAPPGQLTHINYGKGVTFWDSEADASAFVSDYGDIISADNYWFTDPNICQASEGGTLFSPARELSQTECRAAANYGWTVKKVRSLLKPQGSKPVWAMVEVGHPASEPDSPTIDPEQVRAAVWSSLIHGAQGIVYFNHSFAGSCASQNVLRDCGDQLRATVASLNEQITKLAPVLNAEDIVQGMSKEGAVDVAFKYRKGIITVLATPTQSTDQEFSISVPCAGNAQVTGAKWSNHSDLDQGRFSATLPAEQEIAVFSFSSGSCGIDAG